MIQHGECIEECASDGEDDVPSVCDEPFLEGQLVAHAEPVLGEDEQQYFGPAICEEWIDIQTASEVVVFVDTCWEMLDLDRVVLQETSRCEEHGVSDQRREELLEIVVHPSLGLSINDM